IVPATPPAGLPTPAGPVLPDAAGPGGPPILMESPPAPAADGDSGDRYKDVPPVAVLPRPGWFPIPPSGQGYCNLCNELGGNFLQAPPKYPYSRTSIQANSFFDVDWRYLDDPKNTEHDCFDCLKRIRFGPNDLFMFTTGGEFRARYEYQENAKLSNAT